MFRQLQRLKSQVLVNNCHGEIPLLACSAKKHLMFAGSFLIFLGEIMVFLQKKKTSFFQMKSQLFFRLNMFYGVFFAQG
jgi:hypothetical protein